MPFIPFQRTGVPLTRTLRDYKGKFLFYFEGRDHLDHNRGVEKDVCLVIQKGKEIEWIRLKGLDSPDPDSMTNTETGSTTTRE